MEPVTWDAELNRIKSRWEKTCEILATRQLSPQNVRSLYITLEQDERGFRLFYASFEKNRVHGIGDSVFNQIRHELDLAIQKGEENYRNEMHRQKMEYLDKLGIFLKNLGVNIASIVLGIIIALLVIKFGYKGTIPFPP